ncbi:cytochrome P450 [Actinocorallia herbida]|uniref:Cytochrome P450 n=1 Tax=Actinocorallia herbida TaxID=58109 RepID=A0A3N1D2I0_9ACTN|nr:cytochrome P450 [Actinocorallia herbida]ROO87278.1 cytochrome P450 [Actinocorallia herbida]
MDLFTTAHPFTTGVDISSDEFWSKPFDERDKAFARLRAEAPVSWHPPVSYPAPHGEQGFWAVTRAADITTVSMDSETFQSRNGFTLDPIGASAAGGSFFLAMDPPEHSRYRSLVSAAFTPKQIKKIDDRIAANAHLIVDDLIGAGEVDFVEACSSRLPMETVSDIVGVPASERKRVAQAAENLFGAGEAHRMAPEEAVNLKMEEAIYLYSLAKDLAAHRRANPADDLLTNLVQAEIDGHGLTDDDIGAFMLLMATAGNDTTKQTTSHTMLSLAAHPEQRDWLMKDFDGRIMGAIEEFVRHATPVMTFTRTASRDVELNGAQIAAGDKVAMFYCSGNRDESVFDNAAAFDLSRPRFPRHVAFGGGGTHFCLGNGVAKVQLRSIIGELLRRLPDITFGTPVAMKSNFVNGIESLPAHVG